MSIAPELAGLPAASLHLLEQVLAVGWGVYRHGRGGCVLRAVEGAGERGLAREGARVARLAKDVVAAKERDWLLVRQVEVLGAFFATKHTFNKCC